jgi:hypothetical protein
VKRRPGPEPQDAAPRDRGSSFFLDSTGYSALDEKHDPAPRRASSALIFLVVLAAALAIAGLFGATYLARR